jgi:hypothetical protein
MQQNQQVKNESKPLKLLMPTKAPGATLKADQGVIYRPASCSPEND